jgi:hypothetical protein
LDFEPILNQDAALNPDLKIILVEDALYANRPHIPPNNWLELALHPH